MRDRTGTSDLTRKRRHLSIAGVGLLAMLGAVEAQALRCGNRLVDIGARTTHVLERCGEPVSVDRWTETRTLHEYYRLYNRNYEWREPVVIVIEEWLYDFGSTRFQRLLRFENGVLKKIESLRYGE